VGQILHDQLRATDAPCRYGGEEFGVILSETDEEGAYITAERLRQRIAHYPFRPKDRHIEVTASFGLASSSIYPKGAVTHVRLLGAADEALYRAKHEGRNKVCVAKANPAVRV
jgi:diguanylate cyclase (GGDEF)-like protein